MIRASVNKVECRLFYDERVSSEEAPEGYPYMYHLRHDEDNWINPVNIEPFVAVNFFGTVFMKEPVSFDGSGYIEIESFEMQCDFIRFEVGRGQFEKMFGL